MKKKIYELNKTIILMRLIEAIIIAEIILQFKFVLNISGNYYLNLRLLIIIPVLSWIVLLVHEVGHCLAVKRCGYKVISIHLPLIQLRFGSKVNVYRNSFSFEGMIIPEIPPVKTKQDFEDVRRYIRGMLLGGPFATAISGSVFFLVVRILVWRLREFQELEVIVLIILFESFFILHNCFKTSKDKIGDIVAVKMIDENDFFLSCRLYEWMFFQCNFSSVISTSVYIKSIIREKLKYISSCSMDDLGVIDTVLYYATSGLDDYFLQDISEVLPLYMEWWFERMSDKAEKWVDYTELYMNGIIYLANKSSRELAEYYYNKIKPLVDECKEEKKICYIIAKMEQVVNSADNVWNYKMHPDYIFFRVFENHLQCEMMITTCENR